ncbi:protein SODIUM POTASSIUM ROOT DEFECTIVE 2-like [Salvia miltiorrhiza]|uniref:protein SODIUM POTASSIUM ROOT DEFECTIVE 2-like n=1 Tax=Salvia miltiorrhiza TaxID=226208 RepID=UPI0025AC3A8B|nr:protein SODIUM POTASSIUM ROOT DEFECTIVE 2-like [Salvia miltiorrhiza]
MRLKMKSMDILQAATAICPNSSSMELEASSSALALAGSSSPAIDRYNPIIRDSRRCAATPLPPLIHKKNVNPRKSWSCAKPGDFISPPGSTRYLLSGKELLTALDPPPTSIDDLVLNNQTNSSSPSPDQVVVLRVSLHCRGCERKMRKHISRMEGVRSFNIDFAAKKVTVAGKVTPLEVLSSISKVKNAQLWAPTISSEFKGAWVTDKAAFVGVA